MAEYQLKIIIKLTMFLVMFIFPIYEFAFYHLPFYL